MEGAALLRRYIEIMRSLGPDKVLTARIEQLEKRL